MNLVRVSKYKTMGASYAPNIKKPSVPSMWKMVSLNLPFST